ncbi:MAG: FkbM family methyltransferase [Ignavibacteria bacterium]|jgi:FkbM family methyltransferase
MFKPNLEYLETAIENIRTKKLVFWGVGRKVRNFIKIFCLKKKILPLPQYICDSTRDLTEKEILGIPVIEFEDLKKFDSTDTAIIITAGLMDLQVAVTPNEFYYFPVYHFRSFEVYDFLKKEEEKLNDVLSLFEDDQSRQVYEKIFKNILNGTFWDQSLYEPDAYFGNSLFNKFNDDDHFILAGAFNGKHIVRALNNNNKIQVTGFEPNLEWYNYLTNKFADNNNIEIINKVLWNSETELKFDGNEFNSGLDAHVLEDSSEEYDFKITSTTIDSLNRQKPSLIALDVEGSELKALEGAKDSILKDKPKLAICLYHKLEDFIEIPLMINELTKLNPYKYYVKHHSCITAIETVLYAV